MANSKKRPLSTELIDEQTVFTLADLCRSCAVEAEFIEAMVEQGIIEPTSKRGRHWCFAASSLRRTRVTVHLQKDLGVNLAGAALALELMERIDKIESQLRVLGGLHNIPVDTNDD